MCDHSEFAWDPEKQNFKFLKPPGGYFDDFLRKWLSNFILFVPKTFLAHIEVHVFDTAQPTYTA